MLLQMGISETSCTFELFKRGSQGMHPLPKLMGVRKSLRIVSHNTCGGKQAASLLDTGPQKVCSMSAPSKSLMSELSHWG